MSSGECSGSVRFKGELNAYSLIPGKKSANNAVLES